MNRLQYTFSFLLLVSLLSCGIRTRGVQSVRYYASKPGDTGNTAFVDVPVSKILPFLRHSRRTPAYLPKGSMGYLELVYKKKKESTWLKVIPGKPYPFRVDDGRINLLTDKWYGLKDSTEAKAWYDLLRDCRKEFDKKYNVP